MSATLLDRWKWIEAVARDNELPPRATQVAVILAKHLNSRSYDTVVWPSRKTIARHLGCEEKAVTRALAALRDRGWIDFLPGGPSKGHSRRYRLLLDRATEMFPVLAEATRKAETLYKQPLDGTRDENDYRLTEAHGVRKARDEFDDTEDENDLNTGRFRRANQF